MRRRTISIIYNWRLLNTEGWRHWTRLEAVTIRLGMRSAWSQVQIRRAIQVTVANQSPYNRVIWTYFRLEPHLLENIWSHLISNVKLERASLVPRSERRMFLRGERGGWNELINEEVFDERLILEATSFAESHSMIIAPSTQRKRNQSKMNLIRLWKSVHREKGWCYNFRADSAGYKVFPQNFICGTLGCTGFFLVSLRFDIYIEFLY